MKVAFVSYDFGEYCIRHANGLAPDCDVLLVLNQDLPCSHLKLDPAVRFHPFHAPRLRQPWRQIRNAYCLVRAIRAFKPDVIHLQRGHLWFNLALPLLRMFPLVVTMHDVRHHVGDQGSRKTPPAIMNIAYRRADQIIVHGQWLKQAAVRELGLAADRIHVIPHVAVGPPAIELPEAEDENLVLFFGRIWPYKGLEYLIRAEPLVTAEVPEARIAIAGTGEPFDRYRRMMVHPDRFLVYNHWISDTLQAELFHRASVVVLPYIEASQSGVIPCAYSCAKPVIATRTGSLPEMVEHGRTGYLVAPGDEKALADAIIDLLRHKELRHCMGDNGQRLSEALCSPTAVVSKTMGVYRQAIAARVNGRGRR